MVECRIIEFAIVCIIANIIAFFACKFYNTNAVITAGRVLGRHFVHKGLGRRFQGLNPRYRYFSTHLPIERHSDSIVFFGFFYANNVACILIGNCILSVTLIAGSVDGNLTILPVRILNIQLFFLFSHFFINIFVCFDVRGFFVMDVCHRC